MARIIKSDAAPRPAPGMRAPQVVGQNKKVVAREVFSAGNRAEQILADAHAEVEARRQRAEAEAQAAYEAARDAQARTSQVAALVEVLRAYHRRGLALAGARDQCLHVANTLVQKITGQAMSLPRAEAFPVVDAALRGRRGRHQATLDLAAEDVEAIRGIPGMADALDAAPEVSLQADGAGVLRVAAGEQSVDARMAAQALCTLFDLELPAEFADPVPGEGAGEEAAAAAGEDGAGDADGGAEQDHGNEDVGQDAEGDAEEEEPPAEEAQPPDEDTSWAAEDEPVDDGTQDVAPLHEEEDPDAAGEDVDMHRQELRAPPPPAINPDDFGVDESTRNSLPTHLSTQERSAIRAAPGRAAPVPPARTASASAPPAPAPVTIPGVTLPRPEGTRVEALPRQVRVTDEPSVSMRVRPLPYTPAEEKSASRITRPLPPAPSEDASASTMAFSPEMVAEVRRQLPPSTQAPPPAQPVPNPTRRAVAIPPEHGTRVDVRQPPEPPRKPR